MAPEGYKRKLTAILSADVAGYSRLMGDDESATVETLNIYKEIIIALVQQHRGRVVDFTGDNLLAEFASVVDAVQCGVAVQKELQVSNSELPDNRRMAFRIGINLGDVIEEGDRIYGDGVNVAARLEALADPGGICVSKTAFDQIESKLPLGYELLGEQKVKNIPKPIPAYRVLMDAEAAGKVIGKFRSRTTQLRWTTTGGLMALVLVVGAWAIWSFYFRTASPPGLELPDKPSIVVLPFDNLSGDPNQEYFADGITNAIIYRLYRMPTDMLVIDRTSSRTYKGKSVKVQEVGQELRVRYVLEGSVEKSIDRVRITVNLIDAVSGEQLWGDRYDRKLTEVFAVQDEITRKVVTELGVKIAMGERWRIESRATDNLEALESYMQADKMLSRGVQNKEYFDRMRGLIKKAIELDPKFSRAIAWLGYTNLTYVNRGWSKNITQSRKQAEDMATQALAIDDNNYMAHSLMSRIYLHKRRYKEAIEAGKRAVDAEPNNSLAYYFLGDTMNLAGRPEEALEQIRKAIRLSPYAPYYVFWAAGVANYLTGRYEEAIIEFNKIINRWKKNQRDPTALNSFKWLIASYMALGQEKEAQAEARKLLEQHPDFLIESYIKKMKRHPYKDYAFLDRQVELLHKAGLK